MGPRPILAALVAVGLSMALAGPALAAPAVSYIIPRIGTHFGGTSVTILGRNLTGATAVNFGKSNPASFTVNSNTQITAVSPPGAEGSVPQVTVTTPEGTSTTPSSFGYVKSCVAAGPAPEVSGVAPSSARGGTRVTISGFRFFGASECVGNFHMERVFFGLNEAHFEAVNGGIELVAVAPGSTGTVDVRVETPLGASPVTESDQFTTLPGPIYHWYHNDVQLTAGEEAPIVMFGNEVNLSSSGGLGASNCRTVGGGTIENPVGGGAGVGRTNSFDHYECKAPTCEARVKEKTGLEGRLTVTSGNNPAATKEPAFPGWNDALEESTVGGVFSVREKIGEPFTSFKTPSPPGIVRETDTCIVASTGQVVEEATSEGELKPEIGPAKAGNLNGSSAGGGSVANEIQWGTRRTGIYSGWRRGVVR
jgi:hypothetical protein